MRICVEPLTEQAFAECGTVLGEPSGLKPNIQDEVSDVWLGFADLMGIGGVPCRAATYLKIHTRPAVYDKMEKHETSAEAFIPLEGRSVLVVAPPEAVDAQGRPDMTRARAFLMDGSRGILMRPGTWHAVPYKLSEVAPYLVLVDDAIIAKDDLHVNQVEPMEFDFSALPAE
jgi:ureidoglycolate hydrolase